LEAGEHVVDALELDGDQIYPIRLVRIEVLFVAGPNPAPATFPAESLATFGGFF
jgi:hypothetical protein